MMKQVIAKEWLLATSAIGWGLMAFYMHRLPRYDWASLEPIFLLWVLFVVIKGIERHGLLQALARRMEYGKLLAPKMVLMAFLFSLGMSIDASLAVLMPIIFAFKTRRKLALALLVALTAHLGSALTPFGTPQNLFIYSYYDPGVWTFVRTIAPLSFSLLALYFLVSFFVPIEATKPRGRRRHAKIAWHPTLGYLAGFVLSVAVVVRLLPWWAMLPIIAIVAAVDRNSLRIDYALLATFVLFLGLADNARVLIGHDLDHPHHIFVLSATLSQMISNVPTTLLLTPFTQRWEALLWGTNVGSFGTPVAAMANLIAYRLVRAHSTEGFATKFLLLFTLAGAASLFVGAALYFGYAAARIGQRVSG